MTPQKRAALTSLCDLLPGLTESELWRLAGLVRATLRQRIEGPTASDWSAEAIPAVEVAHAVASEIDGLYAASGILYVARQFAGNAEALERIKAGESAVDTVLATALHHGLRTDDLAALAMLLAAHRDGAPPT